MRWAHMALKAISRYFSLTYCGLTDGYYFIKNIIYTLFLMENRMTCLVSALPIGKYKRQLLLLISAFSRPVPSRYSFFNWRFLCFFLIFRRFSCFLIQFQLIGNFFLRTSAFFLAEIIKFSCVYIIRFRVISFI